MLEDINQKNNAITSEEGQKAADDNKFHCYMECSAKLGENCNGVFYEAIKASEMMKDAKNKIKEERGRCCSIF